MNFMDLTKKELAEAANFYKVDFNVSDNKEEISMALLDAGHTPEEWEKDREEWLNGESEEEESAEEDSEEEQEETSEDETEPPADEEELVLVRFTGRNRSYKAGRFRFTQSKPFALMTREEFDNLRSPKFREASKAEAAEFYGN